MRTQVLGKVRRYTPGERFNVRNAVFTLAWANKPIAVCKSMVQYAIETLGFIRVA